MQLKTFFWSKLMSSPEMLVKISGQMWQVSDCCWWLGMLLPWSLELSWAMPGCTLICTGWANPWIWVCVTNCRYFSDYQMLFKVHSKSNFKQVWIFLMFSGKCSHQFLVTLTERITYNLSDWAVVAVTVFIIGSMLRRCSLMLEYGLQDALCFTVKCSLVITVPEPTI